MKISVVNKNINIYISSSDGEDEVIMAVSISDYYDFNTMTIKFAEGHEAIDEFNVEDFCDYSSLDMLPTTERNTFRFIRR